MSLKHDSGDSKRREQAAGDLELAMNVAVDSMVPFARSIWCHFERHTVIVRPVPGEKDYPQMCQLAVFGDNRGQRPLAVMPIYEEDRFIGGPIEYTLDDLPFGGAKYLPGLNLIVYPVPQIESDFRVACMLLHEGGHALRALEDGRIGTARLGGLEEEFEMWTLEAALWKSVNPFLYQNLMEAAAQISITDVGIAEKVIGVTMNREENWRHLLDQLIGPLPTPSAESQLARNTIVRLFAIFNQINNAGFTPSERSASKFAVFRNFCLEQPKYRPLL